jgi:hypothetical protein
VREAEFSEPTVTLADVSTIVQSGCQPYWVGKDAKQSAVDYAKARAKYGRGEIRVLRDDGLVESVTRV